MPKPLEKIGVSPGGWRPNLHVVFVTHKAPTQERRDDTKRSAPSLAFMARACLLFQRGVLSDIQANVYLCVRHTYAREVNIPVVSEALGILARHSQHQDEPF